MDCATSVKDDSFLPSSHLFEVKQTLHAGRGLFATQDIPKGTVILKSDFTSIVVILREYRREVCARCFGYERGRNLKIRDAPTNFSFCSLSCSEAWKSITGELAIQAWTTLETFLKNKAGKGNNGFVNAVQEPADDEGDIAMGDFPRHPSKEEIDVLWSSVEATASLIRSSRQEKNPTKPQRRAVNLMLEITPNPDSLYFLLAGVILHYQSSNSSDVTKKRAWEAHLSLAFDDRPYLSASQLRRHVHGYLQLLCILPVDLLVSVTPEICQQTVRHDVHNAFGIRSLDDSGSEFFGWAVWPESSFFNHSCSSNVGKDRDKRKWLFWTRRDVMAGEELMISYLGGDEDELNARERGDRTESIWGFVCACTRCISEKLI